MRKFKNQNIKKSSFRFAAQTILCLLLSCLFFSSLKAQECPPNIDFESGSFNGWTCYSGSVAAVNNENVISLFPIAGPAPDQHTLYSASSSAGLTDYFGGFPVICPNGSNYSVKLGNTSGGAQAEGLSYQFTIPANRNTYSLIYHYAVVFQDPNHLAFQQPRLELEVTDVTDNEPISCSSFTFFPNGSPLPGFFQSGLSDSTAVWCKDWSAVTINLNGKAGKTIKLFFKTADCTFRRQFGYAYIDVNSECSNEFVGATYCPDDTAVNVIAPFGYQSYKWYNNTFTRVLGTQQTIRFTPPPATGTTIAVEIIPFNGYGCQDTLYAKLIDTLTLTADAGRNIISCNKNQVSIGQIPRSGVVYNWIPATGLSNPNIANPRANPDNTTTYTLTVRSGGGGCVNTDNVVVTSSIIDSSLQLLGKSAFCITSSDSAVLIVQPTDSIRWLRNNSLINGANKNKFKVNQSGAYSAMMSNNLGCSLTTRTEQILIETPKPGIVYPVQYAVINYPLQLQARKFGITALWKPAVYLDEPSVFNPVFKSPAELEQLYSIEIRTVTGCLTTDMQLVKTIKEVKIYVPSGFTPNNDGLNDFFKPIMLGIKEVNYFRVYSRWGQLVYNMQPNQPGWNGKIGGIEQPSGVFVWMMQGIGLDNKIHTQKGTIMLIR